MTTKYANDTSVTLKSSGTSGTHTLRIEGRVFPKAGSEEVYISIENDATYQAQHAVGTRQEIIAAFEQALGGVFVPYSTGTLPTVKEVRDVPWSGDALQVFFVPDGSDAHDAVSVYPEREERAEDRDEIVREAVALRHAQSVWASSPIRAIAKELGVSTTVAEKIAANYTKKAV